MFIVNFLQVASFAFIAEYLRPRFFAFSKLMKKSVAQAPVNKPSEQIPKEKVAEEDVKADESTLEFKSEKVKDLYYNHHMVLK